MDISSLKRNTAGIEAGEWISDIPGFGDLRLKVRGMTSAAYERVAAKLSRAVPREKREDDGSLSVEATYDVMGRALHEAVLLDWDGLSQGGTPLPFNSDMALEWLTSPDYRPFADAVTYAARRVDAGRAELEDQLAKN